MNPKRQRKLVLIISLVLGIGVAIGLAMYAMRQNINLFYTPSQLANGEAPDGQRIQAGGLVVKGTVVRDPSSLAVTFMISDLKKQVPVTYTGILPDLFKEGQGIVANGYFKNGRVEAEEVLAKHDENYMPPQVKQAIEEAGHPTGK
ncbi:MAG TPA: cytochrome c maturation protein CcmE [Agitococcus sp.]|mgnify:FL=1|uniref:cytochrome c maturation protein CcmE n=1 Tax=uncultured Agitococcus sp. TaxID=1506599 RepID=UPI002605461F|nr:cytochrome c maturation protein CcmE [uncultured Agitococcus sp.]HMU86846.1 cytochrome c maturation protein CcmE [Agitococcus sp.]HMV59871.1 cytochrome c maturation protein CcmE [Agitococcus sp.]HMX98157.1 cytochrome c maturation protein CcmE [Agitococcus sp.]HMY27879.1 cytochrome c maturation protein CcmE [Agitococcus sp.]HMY81221.1 cytochrome c maturation protein CcmE [Agitococcus sp.]